MDGGSVHYSFSRGRHGKRECPLLAIIYHSRGYLHKVYVVLHNLNLERELVNHPHHPAFKTNTCILLSMCGVFTHRSEFNWYYRICIIFVVVFCSIFTGYQTST